jgi:hypothetical protein
MAKDPAVLFYIDTWLSATAEMDSDVRGWYLNLILHNYDKKSLPNDPEKLAVLAGVKFSEFERFKQMLEQVLKHKFKQNDEGRLENSYAKKILQGRELFKNARSKSGSIGVVIKQAKAIKGFTDKYLSKLKDALLLMDEEEIDKHKHKQVLEHLLKLYINENKNKDTNKDSLDIETKFEKFWKFYERKGSKQETKKLFLKLTDEELELIKVHVAAYKKATPERKFRKDAERYLSHRLWENDDIQFLDKKVEYYTNPFEYWNRDLTPEEWKRVPPEKVQAKKEHDIRRSMGI